MATPTTEIRITNAAFSDIARPALLWTGRLWKLWFDARIANGALHSYQAESTEDIPRNFFLVHSYPDVAGFPGFHEPDVELVNGRYVAVVQRHFATLHKMESADGRNFTEVGTFLSSTYPTFGRTYVSNPGLIYDRAEGTVRGVSFGMTNGEGLSDHDIGFAYTQYQVRVQSCPGPVHIYSGGRYFDQLEQLTFGYGNFCNIQVVDPLTNTVVANQAVVSRPGDVWRFVP
ncbi:hypothetical protein P2318_05635 [Myxococcaceae bacterium GXIMD 01537]